MVQTQCSETLAFELQTPVNHPEESIRHSKHGVKFEIKNLRRLPPENTQHSQETSVPPDGILTSNPIKRAAADPRLKNALYMNHNNYVIHTRDLALSRSCSYKLKSSEMWRMVVGRAIPNVSKVVCAFVFMVQQCYSLKDIIPHTWSLQHLPWHQCTANYIAQRPFTNLQTQRGQKTNVWQ
jgi:hypothetical protein